MSFELDGEIGVGAGDAATRYSVHFVLGFERGNQRSAEDQTIESHVKTDHGRRDLRKEEPVK